MDKAKLKVLLHTVAGLFVLYRGLECFETGKLLPAALYLGFAIICILVAALHKSISRRFVQADTAFFLIESLTLLYTAWHYKSLSINVLYFIYGITGLIVITFSILSINDAEKPRPKYKSRRRRKGSSEDNKNIENGNLQNTGSLQ